MKLYCMIQFFYFNYHVSEYQPPIQLIPKSSAAILNNSLVIYNPEKYGDKAHFNLFNLGKKEIFYYGGRGFHGITNILHQQYDYEFLNLPGSIQSKDKIYVMNSIGFKHRFSVNTTLKHRLSLLEVNKMWYNKMDVSILTEPSFDNFPDFDYSSTLVGTIGDGDSLTNSSLYILGGAKYFASRNSTEIIKSFCWYDFRSNKWEDLTHLLPSDFKPFAGHRVVNVDNEKLVVLGGYRTTEYYDDYSIPFEGSEFVNFQTIGIFDIINQRWEQRKTFHEPDAEHISTRGHYSFPANYYNNQIYVYGGSYLENGKPSNNTSFGVLDLTTWQWRWKQIEPILHYAGVFSTQDLYSLLMEKWMCIGVNSDNLPFSSTNIIIDLDQLKRVDEYEFPDSIFSKSGPYPKPYIPYSYFSTDQEIAISIASISTLMIIVSIICIRYRRRIAHFVGLQDEDEMQVIWSDPTHFIKRHSNPTKSRLDPNESGYQSQAVKYHDTVLIMNLPPFQHQMATPFQTNQSSNSIMSLTK